MFANPRASRDELAEYYATYYSRHAAEGGYDAVWEERRLSASRRHLEEIPGCVPRGRLLDFGAGTGLFMNAARGRGYEVHGVELSPEGVKHAEEEYGLSGVIQGTLADGGYPDGWFDIVYAWHVIEHVDDLDGFVNEVRRVLREGGLLYLGTESYRHVTHLYQRLADRKNGRTSQFVTSSEHTFVFDGRSMSDVLARRGFVNVDVRGYDEVPLRERIRSAWSPSWRRRTMMRLVACVAPLGNALLRDGPFLRVTARVV